MKILHLIDSGGLYGAEKMLLTLVTEQIKQGLDPMILSAGEPGIEEKPIESEARRLNVPVIPWRMKPGLNLKEMALIVRWAKDEQYDLMHSHGYKFNILAGIWPRQWRGMPLIATLHGYVHARRFTKMWIYELLDRLILARFSAVILVSESMRDELSGLAFPKTKVIVIPNGMDFQEVDKRATSELDRGLSAFLKQHRPIILGVGRLAQEKGFDSLVEAFALVKNARPDAGLIIVGEGRLKAQLEALSAAKGLTDSVLIPGFCDNTPALMKGADVLAMPSKTEGLPITILEAMAMELAIVTSPVGAIPALLGEEEGGWLLKSRDPSEIARTLLHSLDNPEERNRKVAWSCRQVREVYAAEQTAFEYSNIYKSVLQKEA
ncbi:MULTISPECIES: glycosyltransferase [Halomonadaceae]|uniref:Glycosyltransferase n=1 Tax=Vreelandella halophila TaxID=86177 RepID=A0A9X5B5T3_9GAMM|nr:MULTISPECIES: glycosyltransferase [Halomonas]MYL26833.1 glycosyltransferase [Halomonas utahensis]MYL74094.1 glycosyltransferase [Halomonas sp. 22501_18_FS]